MNAETLRRAAAEMRDDWDNDTERRVYPRLAATWLAVADWLEEVAAWMDEGVGLLPATNIGDVWIGMRQEALKVARAYLGESS